MYKIQLVTDRENILNAFESFHDWNMLGFRAPHIRHTVEESIQCLKEHHADAIAIALDPADDERLVHYLNDYYPMLPIFRAGTTDLHIRKYLSEVEALLNRIHADLSNGDFTETDMMQICRHDYFRKLMNREDETPEEIIRHMRMVRSRMDPTRPCVVVELAQPEENGCLKGRWHYGSELLEVRLRQCFGAELQGMRILPTVLPDGRILMLCCPLLGSQELPDGESMTALVGKHTEESIAHLREFLDLDLHVVGIRVLNALTELSREP